MEVMTVVEGRVPQSKMKDFESAFASMKGGPTPPGWKMSFMLRDSEDPEVYRLSTLWESREALERYRSNTKVPTAFLLFRSVGVEPQLRVFEIPARLP